MAHRIAELSGGRLTVILSRIADPDCLPQYKAYNHAFSVSSAVLNYQWCAVIDLDEYIALQPPKKQEENSCVGSYLDQWISAMEGESLVAPDVILLNWMFASPSRQVCNFEAILDPLPGRHSGVYAPARQVKSLFRPAYFLGSMAHYPLSSSYYLPFPVRGNASLYDEFYSAYGPGISRRPQCVRGAIIHFYTKSLWEYMWKKSRNTGAERVGVSPHIPSLSEILFEWSGCPWA